eukprot:superscaffoldBa00008925_g23735
MGPVHGKTVCQFESCAQANRWSEKPMVVQLRLDLTRAAGAIVHKNPRSGRWSYQRIVDEIEAAYGPCSEHAAAIGIELKQRSGCQVKPSMQDDINEKVSIMYADCTERELKAIGVETFTNALADAEMIQKLLEEQPRTLAGAYIAHWPESLPVLGEVDIPVHIGSHVATVNFIVADTIGGTEVTLGHPFLLQAWACLDYGCREITLFGEKVPCCNVGSEPEVHFVRVACWTVLGLGSEYVVPGTVYLWPATDGDLLLSPIKCLIEGHCDLVARVVVQARQSAHISIRVFNPGPVLGKLYEPDDVFFTGPTKFGPIRLVQHDILTTPGPPMRQQPRKMAKDKQIDTAAWLMDHVLVRLQWETCLVYLDDIIVLGQDITQMLEWLSQVFNRLYGANLKLKPSKRCLLQEQVSYLGHVVLAKGIATDPQKVQKVVEWPTPQSISEVCQFVGLASYYRHFVEDFATWAKLLHGDKERELASGSRRLSSMEQNYCTTRQELLALVEFTSRFRQYLLRRSFTVRTDHSSLCWLAKLREPEGQFAHWLEKLTEYDLQCSTCQTGFTKKADALSRRLCRSSCPCTMPKPDSSSNQHQHKEVQCSLTDCPAEGVLLTTTPEQTLVGVVDILSNNSYDHLLFHSSVNRLKSGWNFLTSWHGKLWGGLLSIPKRQYDKNIHQVHYLVGVAVWYLIKGTKRVKIKVQKFLPSYEGPYFIVGQLDDLVYHIQRSQRAKVKVVHHDKLKPYHSRTPLDNSWVFQSLDKWAPMEVLPPASDRSSNDPDISPLNLQDTPPETVVTAVEALLVGDMSSVSLLPSLHFRDPGWSTGLRTSLVTG